MILKNGEIIAIGSVNTDGTTLSGKGISGAPLGVNTNILTPYAKTNDVNKEFVDTSAWVNKRFDEIPGAAAYSGTNGIKVDGHMISVSADFATKSYVNAASAAVKSWVVNEHYLQSDALNGYAKESWANDKFLTKTSADTLYQPKGTYLTPDALNPYLTKTSADTIYQPIGPYATSAYVQEEIAKIPGATEYSGGSGISVKDYIISISANYLSANALDGYATEQWVLGKNYLTSDNLTPYAKTEDVKQEFTDTSAWARNEFQVKGDYITSANEQLAGKNLVLKDNKWIEAPSGTVYTQGENINISPNGVISGRDWTPELNEKVDEDFFKATTSALAKEIGKKLDTSATEDWDITPYSQGNEYITIQNHKISGYDWTPELDEKQDLLTIEQISAISSVSAIQILSGNWVTSADNFDPQLSYVLEKDNDTTKWVGYDLSDIGKTYKQGENIRITEDNTISGRDWTPELKEKVDVDKFEEVVTEIATEVGKRLYTSATEDWDVTPYSAGNNLIDVRDHKIYGYDWTPDLDEKQDKLTEEQIEAISSVSAIQIVSGNWVTSGIDTISNPDLAYVLVRDGDSSKWDGVDLAALGKTYNVSSVTENLLTVSAKTADNQTTYILSAADYPEIPEIPGISGIGLDAEYDDENNKYLVTMSARGNNGISAEYDEENNVWDIGISANQFAYMYDSYTNGYVGDVSANTILNFSGTNHNNITVDENGYIILPDTGNKFTFCINEYIDNNNPGTHSYLLNKLTLSSDKGDNLASTMTYYPTEVGASNATLAITIDHSVDPTRKYAVVYEGSTIPLSAYLNATISVLEEVSTLGMINRESNDYVGDKPINVNNDTRHISLGFDTDIFTLNNNQELTLNANGSSGGDTPVDPLVFNKLLNSINGRIVETIPIGVINYATAFSSNYSIAYLFRPMIEFDMRNDTTARFIAGNASAGKSTVLIDVYELNESDHTLRLMWWSETKTLTTSKGEQVLNANNGCTVTRTIYPDRLYYARIICNDHQIQQMLGINNTVTEDIGPYDLVYVKENPDVNPFNLNGRSVDNLGVVANASFKPYIGFKNA